jgi:hypothetical protein
MEELTKCKNCNFFCEKHYERDGEEPYIKAVCKNKFGMNNTYQVRADDFCSRAEPKEVQHGYKGTN